MYTKAHQMARKNQNERINGLCIVLAQLCEDLDQILEIHAPGSEPGRDKLTLVRNMAISLVDQSAGLPFTTDLEPVAPTEGSEP